MNIEIKQIIFGTKEHTLEIDLRKKVLRDPLGLKFSSEELNNEYNHYHIGAFAETQLIGCLVLTPVDEKTIKMRQVAVASETQRLGIGASLVSYSELFSKKMGFDQIILNARLTAIPFYLKLNYEVTGETFTEISIPHLKMKKVLNI